MTVRLLAIDTATEACSAALMIDDEVIERYELAPRRHAELILSMVEAVLAEAEISLAQTDAIAFGRGPGAFTGLRIAASVTQGLAFASNRPVIAISTLDAIARAAMQDNQCSHLIAAIDARLDQVYCGCYALDAQGLLQRLGSEQLCTPVQLRLPLHSSGAIWAGAGSGWGRYADLLSAASGAQQWWPDYYPRAGDIALLALNAWQQGQLLDAADALPLYLRDQVAAHP